MLILPAGQLEVSVANDPSFTAGSADNPHAYDHVYQLGPDSFVASQHSVRVTDSVGQATSCILTAGGGATGIHDATAVIHQSMCLIAIGPFIASLSLPTLEMNWVVQTDAITCFGVHHSPIHDCLISHGELSIARLSYDGTIVWESFGADIFTGDFQLDGDVVCVTDFKNRRYRFDIENGR